MNNSTLSVSKLVNLISAISSFRLITLDSRHLSSSLSSIFISISSSNSFSSDIIPMLVPIVPFKAVHVVLQFVWKSSLDF